jgi:hypothetical protein
MENEKKAHHVCFKNRTMGRAHIARNLKRKRTVRGERRETEPPH